MFLSKYENPRVIMFLFSVKKYSYKICWIMLSDNHGYHKNILKLDAWSGKNYVKVKTYFYANFATSFKSLEGINIYIYAKNTLVKFLRRSLKLILFIQNRNKCFDDHRKSILPAAIKWYTTHRKSLQYAADVIQISRITKSIRDICIVMYYV